MGETWIREGKSRKDLQLYKIHKPVEYKDTTEEWLTVPNTQQQTKPE